MTPLETTAPTNAASRNGTLSNRQSQQTQLGPQARARKYKKYFKGLVVGAKGLSFHDFPLLKLFFSEPTMFSSGTTQVYV